MKSSKGIFIGAILLGILFVFGLLSIAAMVLMQGWAWAITPIFGLPLLSFQQALGLLLVVAMLALPIVEPIFLLKTSLDKHNKIAERQQNLRLVKRVLKLVPQEGAADDSRG